MENESGVVIGCERPIDVMYPSLYEHQPRLRALLVDDQGRVRHSSTLELWEKVIEDVCDFNLVALQEYGIYPSEK